MIRDHDPIPRPINPRDKAALEAWRAARAEYPDRSGVSVVALVVVTIAIAAVVLGLVL
jgi:Tfp pilus assembly protein PilN